MSPDPPLSSPSVAPLVSVLRALRVHAHEPPPQRQSTLRSAMRDRTLLGHCETFLCEVLPESSRSPRYTRLLMTALVLDVAPDALLDDPRRTDAQALLRAVEQLLEACATRHVPSVRTRLTAFIGAFDAWRRDDRERLVSTLVASWRNVDITARSPHCTDDLRARVVDVQKTLLERARGLGVSEEAFRARVVAAGVGGDGDAVARDVADRTGAETGAETGAGAETVADVVRRAFWDDFRRRLTEHDTTQLEALLHELLAAINALTPHRTDLHQTLQTAVDVDLLAQMVRHDCLDADHFGSATRALVDRVASLVAPARAEPLRRWYDEWVEVSPSNPCIDRFPPFLDKLHTEVALAQRACDAVRAALDGGGEVSES